MGKRLRTGLTSWGSGLTTWTGGVRVAGSRCRKPYPPKSLVRIERGPLSITIFFVYLSIERGDSSLVCLDDLY